MAHNVHHIKCPLAFRFEVGFMPIDDKLLRFLGTAFLLLRAQSMFENSAIAQAEVNTAHKEEPPKPSLRDTDNRPKSW